MINSYMIEWGDTSAMLWDISKLINIIGDYKSVQVGAIIVLLVNACVSVNTNFGLDERVAARTAISINRIARWPVIIGVAVVY